MCFPYNKKITILSALRPVRAFAALCALRPVRALAASCAFHPVRAFVLSDALRSAHTLAVLRTLRLRACFLLYALSAVLCIRSAFADSVTIGGSEGWSKLSLRRGVAEGTGRFGYPCIELATDSRVQDAMTDTLFDFEKKPFSDKTGHYTVSKNALLLSAKSAMGKGAALSRGTGGISLRGKRGALFGTEGPAPSFYIEFWLSPAVAENGEVVFNWRSSRSIGRNIVYQMITASFYQNHLSWTFSNIFDGYDKGDVTLSGITTLIPGTWAHHSIAFDEENGCIEYRVNGMLEAIAYVTSTGRASGSVYPAYFGVPADIELCGKYTGLIDDFRIQRGTCDEAMLQKSEDASALGYAKYRASGGRIETQPLLTSVASSLNSVTALMSKPDQTAVRLYVRSGDNVFDWTDSYPAWRPVRSGEAISGVNGLYFQIAADLYPDGNGSHTPSITQIDIDYTVPPLPLPPFTVKAAAGDGSVTLSWAHSVDENAGGYYVYYGTRPGEYLGRAAREGSSPVDAGFSQAVTLTNLKNGTIYYFAVASYSKLDRRIVGPLSRETYARPASDGDYGK
ncbi:fibronectin type III domain-containing protein [Treponema socranskii]|uniref:fibronectin type III domain-containing protein n=1 Tax=Treponema socranskii TaxID=53419 RepID=UPI0028EEBA1D|nr:fibronectin type III domain-containing protein [Treponema socranskii]